MDISLLHRLPFTESLVDTGQHPIDQRRYPDASDFGLLYPFVSQCQCRDWLLDRQGQERVICSLTSSC
ncbi:hypothetical protein SBBP1_1660002 [Burkholderiales bacterium]|nr:hypothetical protein SBBP1_1660002 [Burkholderiales bacterium]